MIYTYRTDAGTKENSVNLNSLSEVRRWLVSHLEHRFLSAHSFDFYINELGALCSIRSPDNKYQYHGYV